MGVSFGWFGRVSELQILKIDVNQFLGGKAEQKTAIYVATDKDFLKVTLYSVTIAIK